MLKALLTKKSPFYIQFYVSGKCNMLCRYCNIVEANSNLEEASLNDIEKIADNLARIGAGAVVLMGGEPFLRKDYPQIIKIFVKKGLNVRLQTSGMKVATPEMLKACVEAGASDINVSLDSLNPSKQDYITNVPGSWQEAIKTIAHISRIFPRKDAFTSFGTVLSAFNYGEIPYILELATKIGWQLSLVPAHITNIKFPKDYRSYDPDFIVSESNFKELDSVFKTILNMKKRGFNLFDSKVYLKSALHFIKTGHPTWRFKGVCDSPNLYFVIRPNGDFAVCADYQLKGERVSLIDPLFSKVYKSQKFKKRVYDITKRCKGCQYGSFPEMSLSAHSISAMGDRLKAYLQVQKKGLKPFSYEEILGIINDIKEKHPEIYDEKKHPDKYHNQLILEWEKPDGRRKLQKEYIATRIREGRVRRKCR
ncbi:MAG: radical SAM protein [Nanoarchaeota archaeon]|nr:radical SAM protein [Nanoarchaeota archaeon]